MQESESPEISGIADNSELEGGGEDEPKALEFPDAPEIKEVTIETYEEALIAAEAALVAIGTPQVEADEDSQRQLRSLNTGVSWLESQGSGPPLREEHAERFATFLEAVADRHEKSVVSTRERQDLFGTAPEEDFDALRQRRYTRATGIRDLASNIRAIAGFEKAKEIT